MTLRRASTPQYGGAVYVDSSGSAVLTSCSLINSTASSAGYAVRRGESVGGLGGARGGKGAGGSKAAVRK